MINQFYFIGFGAVASSLVEIMNLEKVFFDIPFVIIEPNDILHPELFENRFAEHIQVALTKDNYKELLKDKKNYIGKLATIRFQNLSEDGIPRFPICVQVGRSDI